MRRLITAVLLILAGPALMVTTGGCGSGDTASAGTTVISGPSDADFFGGYFWQLWRGDVAGPTNASQWGIVTADGTGMINAGLVAQNQGGVLSGPVFIPPLPYAVGANGRVELNIGPSTMEGGISSDGSLLGVAEVTPGLNPALAILPRGVGVWSDADLSGDYHLCAFFYNGGGEVSWWGGTVTFNGAGAVTGWSSGVNINGFINPPAPPMAFGNYSVAPSGLTTWNTPATSMTGGIGLDGELVVLSGNIAAVDLQIMAILIKKGAGLSESTFSGEYHTLVLQGLNAPPPRYVTITGTSTADGAGQWALGEFTRNRDGVITMAPESGPTPYTVGADGTLDIPGPGYVGGVSASGRCAMVAGPDSPGSPLVMFMFR